MTKYKYKKRCRAIFRKAQKLGVKLKFNPNNFDNKRLDCVWYGGNIATIKVSETFAIELTIQGEVRAFLSDYKGEELMSAIDKNNVGAFSKYMLPYINTDAQLYVALDSGRLKLWENNWIEYDGRIKTNGKEVFIDLGMICDNFLDNNILSAIEQTLDSIEEFKELITEIAEYEYGIKVGAA